MCDGGKVFMGIIRQNGTKGQVLRLKATIWHEGRERRKQSGGVKASSASVIPMTKASFDCAPCSSYQGGRPAV